MMPQAYEQKIGELQEEMRREQAKHLSALSSLNHLKTSFRELWQATEQFPAAHAARHLVDHLIYDSGVMVEEVKRRAWVKLNGEPSSHLEWDIPRWQPRKEGGS